jgi:hypothetical protein
MSLGVRPSTNAVAAHTRTASKRRAGMTTI